MKRVANVRFKTGDHTGQLTGMGARLSAQYVALSPVPVSPHGVANDRYGT